MSEDICPSCDDPFCSCDCAMCHFVGVSDEATELRKKYEGVERPPRSGLDGDELCERYHKQLLINTDNKAAIIRKRMGLADDYPIPEYVLQFLPLELVPLTGKDLEWAKQVAQRYEDGEYSFDEKVK